MACSLTVRCFDHDHPGPDQIPVQGITVVAEGYSSGSPACGGPVIVTLTGETGSDGEITWDTTGFCSASYHITTSGGDCWFATEDCYNSVIQGGSATDPVFEIELFRTNAGGCQYDCDECVLSIQVNSACDGSLVDGGTFTLVGAGSCSPINGTCTISGITYGTYDWTWTKTGWETKTGTFTCECAGGPQTIYLDVTPDGGCDGTADVDVVLTDFCTGAGLSGVLIVLDEGTDDEESCTTGVSGVCEFMGVAAGEHTLTISKSGYNTQERTFTVTGAGSEGITVTVALVPVGGCDGSDRSVCRDELTFEPFSDRGMRFLRPEH